MARGLTPYRYRPGNSPLHRLPAGLKLGALALLSCSVLIPGPLFLVVPALLVAAGAWGAGIGPGGLLRGSRPLALLAGAAALFRALRGTWAGSSGPGGPPVFDGAEFLAGCRFGGGLLVSFAAGALLFSVTTTVEIRASLETLEGALLRPFPGGRTRPRRLSLGIALMLGFLPRFFEAWENAALAWKARGGREGPVKLAVLIPLVTERMMGIAVETAQALEARGL